MQPVVRLLGTPQIWTGGGWQDLPLDKRLALLTHLACADGWVTRERLSYLFWPDVPTSQARINLRQLLVRTRAVSHAIELEIESQRLRWRVESDVTAFRKAVAAEDWAAAMAAYEGDLVEGLDTPDADEFANWLEFERTRLREEFRQAALHRAETAVREGKPDEADRILADLLNRDPLDETVVQRRLRLHVESGAHGEAHRLYEKFAAVMQEELGLLPSAATEAILRSPHSSARRARASPASVRLREPLTSFVGRDEELATITARMTEEPCRLLTLLGPGGTGKTRLALRAAATLTASFADGVYYVPLAAVVAPASFPLALAAALNIDIKGAEPPLRQVVKALRNRSSLLVLDQFEHIADAALSVSEILTACTDVRCLVTSRERLRLEGEWLLPITGLDVPAGSEMERQRADEFSAVKLLVDRARQVEPNFRITPQTMALAVELCRVVDGLPLGIELAAGSLRSMPLEDTVRALKLSPGGLATDSLDVPERHRSLRKTFDHSWRLLAPQEQTALARVSVFVGDFDKTAATFVTGATLPVLTSLVDKSLLRLSADDRYDVHPAVREMAKERLEEDAADLDRTKAQHSTYYLHLLGAWNGRIHGPEQLKMIEQIAGEYANVRLAWFDALERSCTEEAANAREPLVIFHGIQGRFVQGADLFGQSVSTVESAPGKGPGLETLMGHLLADQAWFLSGMGRFDEAVATARRSLETIEGRDEPAVELRARQVLGSIAARRGDYDGARADLQASLDSAKRVADAWGIGLLAGQLGLLELRVGNLDQASSLFTLALEVNEEMGNKAGVVNDLDYLGRLALQRGDTASAAESFERALALAESSRFHLRVAYLRLQLGVALERSGDAAAALAHARAALAEADEHQQRAVRAEALLLIGRLTAETNAGDEKAEAHMVSALSEAVALGEVPLMLAAVLELTLQRPGDEALARLSLIANHPAAQWDVRERARRELVAATVAPADLNETVAELLASRGTPY